MAEFNVFEIDIDKVRPGALKQMIQEVRIEESWPVAYDRCHCRHNRGRGLSGDQHEEWARSKTEDV